MSATLEPQLNKMTGVENTSVWTQPWTAVAETGLPDGNNVGVPLWGLPGPTAEFYMLHATAVVSLSISVLFSAGVLIYLRPIGGDFWKRPIPQRLVVYLAMCDLLFSLTHLIDHAYVMGAEKFLPDVVCQAFAFSLYEFTLSQAVLVTYTAFSAFVMIVRERRLPLGRYDWRLLLAVLGAPFVLVLVAACFGYLGPSGAWCAADMGETYGPTLANSISIVIMATFFVNMVCYVLIWLKITQVSRSMAAMDERAASHAGRYQRTVRMLMLFVAVYIGQWWAYVIYGIWTYFGIPHIGLLLGVVFFSNMGGFFNCIAYTFIRRLGQGDKGQKQPGTSNTTSTMTLSESSSATPTNKM